MMIRDYFLGIFRHDDGIGTMLKRILSCSHTEVFTQILNYLQI